MSSPRADPRANEDIRTIKADEKPIKVLVGPDKHAFYIHERVLRKSGAFFNSALKEKWRPDQDSVVLLPKDKPAAFTTYVEWLYTGKIPCKTDQDHRNYNLLIDLYCLGDKLLDTVFQDRVMDALVAASHDTAVLPPFESDQFCPTNAANINRIYQNTRPGAPIRAFVINVCVLHGHEGWCADWLENREKVNQEFFFDLAVALMKKREVPDDLRGPLEKVDANPRCAYHHHGVNDPCENMSSDNKDDGESDY